MTKDELNKMQEMLSHCYPTKFDPNGMTIGEAQALLAAEIHSGHEYLPQTRQMIIENRAYTITFTKNGGFEYRPGEYIVPPTNSLRHTFDMGAAWVKTQTVDLNPTRPGNTLGPIEAAIDTVLFGIDKTETEHRSGWWETSVGAEFGATKLRELKATIARFFKPA